MSSDLLYYAGIGSRETPTDILNYMAAVARRLAKLGFVLRSGGAKGADKAFEDGAGVAVILRPEDATIEAIKVASQFHPAWHRCSAYTQRLHGRNVMIILGDDDLEDEKMWVTFVICWTPPNIDRGGTKLGMRVAEDRGIPVFNLAVFGVREGLEMVLAGFEAADATAR